MVVDYKGFAQKRALNRINEELGSASRDSREQVRLMADELGDLERAKKTAFDSGRYSQSRYLSPMDMKLLQLREKRILEDMYRDASGGEKTQEEILGELARSRDLRAASRGMGMAGKRTSGANPAQAAALAEAAHDQYLAGRDLGRASEGLSAQASQRMEALRALEGARSRNRSIQDSLRDAAHREQLEKQELAASAQLANEGYLRNQIDAYNQRKAESSARNQQTLGSFLGAGAGILAAAISDRRAKMNIRDAGERIDEIFRKVKPREFEYREEVEVMEECPHCGHMTMEMREEDFDEEEGRRIGVMAQDMEEAGLDEMILDGPGGLKAIDLSQMIPMIFASNARLHERMDDLERPRKKRRKE